MAELSEKLRFGSHVVALSSPDKGFFSDAGIVEREVVAYDRKVAVVALPHLEGRLYLDVTRNAYGQTSVLPYGVRAKPGAPVATPLDWDELARGDLHPQSYTLRKLLRRLGQKDDPWSDFRRHAKGIGAGSKQLQTLTEEERS